MVSKMERILASIFYGFGSELGSILAPKLEPCWPLVRPKIAQDGFKMRPRAAREASRSRLGANSRPRRAQTPSRLGFGSFLATMLDNCGSKIGQFLSLHFGKSYKTRPRPSKYRAQGPKQLARRYLGVSTPQYIYIHIYI